MGLLEKLYNFENLYNAHKKSRLGKRNNKEVIDFEMNLAKNIVDMSDAIKNKKFSLSPYYNFKVYDPKTRDIYALHYKDRVFEHCLCDEILAPLIEKKLIYDNAACRIGKGTRFALNRLKYFMNDYFNKNKDKNNIVNLSNEGYFLKCDIKKYFDNIDHNILKKKIRNVINEDSEPEVIGIIDNIIDSYEKKLGKGLPLGNQSSQWFAIYYLDSLDRLVKEKLKIKYYTRYMDDMILITKNKDYLIFCLNEMRKLIDDELGLKFNEKTQIFPIRNGVDYLGFHLYMKNNGKIIVKLRKQAKQRIKNNLKKLKYEYYVDMKDVIKIRESLVSMKAHISYGNTYNYWKKLIDNTTFIKSKI